MKLHYLYLVLISFLSYPVYSQKDTAAARHKYTYVSLQKCNGDCASYLTDSTSRIKLVKLYGNWVDLIHPEGQIIFEKKQYAFSKDLIPLAESSLKYATFIPVSVAGYLISNGVHKYLILDGGILGSTGISGNYSLVVVIDLNTLQKNKRRRIYGLITPEFSIKDVDDFNRDGVLDIRLKKSQRKMISLWNNR